MWCWHPKPTARDTHNSFLIFPINLHGKKTCSGGRTGIEVYWPMQPELPWFDLDRTLWSRNDKVAILNIREFGWQVYFLFFFFFPFGGIKLFFIYQMVIKWDCVRIERWIIWITIMGALVEGWVRSDLDCHCGFLSAIRNDEFYCLWVVSEIDKYDSLYQSSLVSEFGNNTLLLSSLY